MTRQVFLADKELRKLGIADYGKAIDEALDSSAHMIVVCSNPEYLEKEKSPYVYSEWHTFTEEIRSGRKKGNLMTVLTDNVKIKDLPIALRNSQSFPLSDYGSIITYLDYGIASYSRNSLLPRIEMRVMWLFGGQNAYFYMVLSCLLIACNAFCLPIAISFSDLSKSKVPYRFIWISIKMSGFMN